MRTSFAGRSSSTAVADVFGTTTQGANTLVAFAAAWNTDDVEAYYNGASEGTPDTDAAMPTGLTTIRLGERVSGGVHHFGHIRNVQIFGERLTDFDVARIA